MEGVDQQDHVIQLERFGEVSIRAVLGDFRGIGVDERRDEFTKLKSENVDIHNRHKTVP